MKIKLYENGGFDFNNVPDTLQTTKPSLIGAGIKNFSDPNYQDPETLEYQSLPFINERAILDITEDTTYAGILRYDIISTFTDEDIAEEPNLPYNAEYWESFKILLKDFVTIWTRKGLSNTYRSRAEDFLAFKDSVIEWEAKLQADWPDTDDLGFAITLTFLVGVNHEYSNESGISLIEWLNEFTIDETGYFYEFTSELTYDDDPETFWDHKPRLTFSFSVEYEYQHITHYIPFWEVNFEQKIITPEGEEKDFDPTRDFTSDFYRSGKQSIEPTYMPLWIWADDGVEPKVGDQWTWKLNLGPKDNREFTVMSDNISFNEETQQYEMDYKATVATVESAGNITIEVEGGNLEWNWPKNYSSEIDFTATLIAETSDPGYGMDFEIMENTTLEAEISEEVVYNYFAYFYTIGPKKTDPIDVILDFWNRTEYGTLAYEGEFNGEKLTKTTFSQTFLFDKNENVALIDNVLIYDYPLMPETNTFWQITKKEYLDNNTWKFSFNLNPIASFGFEMINDNNKTPISRSNYYRYFKPDDEAALIPQKHNTWKTISTKYDMLKDQNLPQEDDYQQARELWVIATFRANSKSEMKQEIRSSAKISAWKLPYYTVLLPISWAGTVAFNFHDGDGNLTDSFSQPGGVWSDFIDNADLISIQLTDTQPIPYPYFYKRSNVYNINNTGLKSYEYFKPFVVDEKLLGILCVGVEKKTFEFQRELLFPEQENTPKLINRNIWNFETGFIDEANPDEESSDRFIFGEFKTGDEPWWRLPPFTYFEFGSNTDTQFSSNLYGISDIYKHSSHFLLNMSDTTLLRDLKGLQETISISRKDLSAPFLSDEFEEYQTQKKSNILNNFFRPIATGAIAGGAAGSIVPGAGTGVGALAGGAAGGVKALTNVFFKRQTLKDTPDQVSGGSSEAITAFQGEHLESNTLWIHEPSKKDREEISFLFHKFGSYRGDVRRNIFDEINKRKRFNFIQTSITDANDNDVFKKNYDKELIVAATEQLNDGIWLWNTLLSNEELNEIKEISDNFFSFGINNPENADVALDVTRKLSKRKPLPKLKKSLRKRKSIAYIYEPPEKPEEKYDITELAKILKVALNEEEKENGKKTKRNKQSRKK